MGTTELSPTEIKILELAADGLSYPDMVEEIGHTSQTIKNKAIKIRAKLGADNLTQAVAMAIRRKIIE